MTSPLVSVLIPAYNAAPWISQTLECVLAQSGPAKEIIVVDDGSTDDTVAVARCYEAQGVQVYTQQNSGAAAARNHAFNKSTGTYIQYIDADGLLAPDKIEVQMKRFAAMGYPQDILLSGRFAFFTHQPGDQESENIPLYKDFPNPLDWIDVAWNQGYFITVHGWLTPRHLIENAGPWNETLSVNDDGEFFGRVVLQSKGVYHCDNARAYYRKVSGSLSKTVSSTALTSILEAAHLYEKALLSTADTPATRHTCANVYMRILHFFYPAHYKALLPAEAAVKRLGGGSLKLMGNGRVRFMEGLIGWKATRRLILFLQENQLNPRAVLKKAGISLKDNKNKYT